MMKYVTYSQATTLLAALALCCPGVALGDKPKLSEIINRKGKSEKFATSSFGLLGTTLEPGPKSGSPEKSGKQGPGSLREAAAATGHLRRLTKDALELETGSGDRNENARKAFNVYVSGSAAGSALATYHVARCYGEGIGVKRNFEKAREFMKSAIRQAGAKISRVDSGINPFTEKRLRGYPASPIQPKAMNRFRSATGRIYVQPKLISITRDGIQVMHDSGIATLQWWQVPAYTQREAGYYYTDLLLRSVVARSKEAAKKSASR